VVGGDDDDGVLGLATDLQRAQQPPEHIVAIADHGVVGGGARRISLAEIAISSRS
jgi:hypothetical protein